MRQISELNIARFRNEEDFGFHTRVLALATQHLTLETDKNMVDEYAAGVNRLDAALQQALRNSVTASLSEADEKADTLRSYSAMYLRSLAKHPDGEVAKIALRLSDIYAKYGEFMDMGYDEEYGRYRNLNADLENVGAETLERIHFMPWLTAMKEAVDDFLALRAAKVEESSLREVGAVKEARTVADGAYRKVVKRINALIVVNEDDAPYAAFIDRLHVMIAEAQAELKARDTRAANAEAKKAAAAGE